MLPDCLVFRPKPINIRLLVAALLPLITVTWMIFFFNTSYYSKFVNNAISFTNFFNVLLLSVCIAIILVAIIVKRVRKRTDALLILFSEGVVQCEQYSNEAKRYFNVIAFANLLHLEARTLPRNKNIASLKLRYKDGNEEGLTMDNKFGPTAQMAQRVVAHYARYMDRSAENPHSGKKSI